MGYSFNGTTEGMLFDSFGSTETLRFASSMRFRINALPGAGLVAQLWGIGRDTNPNFIGLHITETGLLQPLGYLTGLTEASADSLILSTGVDYTLTTIVNRASFIFSVYLNGVLIGTGTATSTTHPAALCIGYRARSTDSSYANIHVWEYEHQVLTADQFTAINNADVALANHHGLPLAHFVTGSNVYTWNANFDAGGDEILWGQNIENRRTTDGGTSFFPIVYATYDGTIPLPAVMRSWYDLSPEDWTGAKIAAFNGTTGGDLQVSGGIGFDPYPRATAGAPTRRHIRKAAGSSAPLSIHSWGSLYDGSGVMAYITGLSQRYYVIESMDDGSKMTSGKQWSLNVETPSVRYTTATVNGFSIPSEATFVGSGQYFDIQAGLLVEHAHVRTVTGADTENRILLSICDLDAAGPGRIQLTPVFLSERFSDLDTDVAAAQSFSITLNSGSKDSIVGRDTLYCAFVDYRNTPKNGGVMWLAMFKRVDGVWTYVGCEELYREDPNSDTDHPGHIHTGYPRVINGQLRYYFHFGDGEQAQHGYFTRSNPDLAVAGTWSTEPVWLTGYRRGITENYIGFLPGRDVDEAFTMGDIDAPMQRIKLDSGTNYTQQEGGLVWLGVQQNAPYETFGLNASLHDDGMDIPKFVCHLNTGAAIGYGKNGRVAGCVDGRHLFVLSTPPIENPTTHRGSGTALADDLSIFRWDISNAGSRIMQANMPPTAVARPLLSGGGNTNYASPGTPILPSGDPPDGYSSVTGDAAAALALIGSTSLPSLGYSGPIPAQVFSDVGTVRETNSGAPLGVGLVVATGVPHDAGRVFSKSWIYWGEPAFDSTPSGRLIQRSENGGSTFPTLGGAESVFILANNMWTPRADTFLPSAGAAFDLGYRINMQSEDDILNDYNGEHEGSFVAWYTEWAKVGAAMVGDPVRITGFTLDAGPSAPVDPYAIGVMGQVPIQEYDATMIDTGVELLRLERPTTVGQQHPMSYIVLEVEQLTDNATDATVRLRRGETDLDGVETDAVDGVTTAALPGKYFSGDPINLMVYRNSDGSVVSCMVSIGGCAPITLSLTATAFIAQPPTQIVCPNMALYGVAVLEDASSWGGLTEDSFKSMADTILAALPSGSSGGFNGGIVQSIFSPRITRRHNYGRIT